MLLGQIRHCFPVASIRTDHQWSLSINGTQTGSHYVWILADEYQRLFAGSAHRSTQTPASLITPAATAVVPAQMAT